MRPNKVSVVSLFVVLMLFLPRDALPTDFSSGVLFGYNTGVGIQLYGKVSDFAQGFPFEARFTIGYTRLKAGNAALARKIFINDATNGNPEKRGWAWDSRFDLMHALHVFSMKNTYIYGGVRYSLFTGNYNFVGGNENFDVTSHQWGFGLGLESHFAMSSRVNLVLNAGGDYFIQNTLSGHDTSYSPDGENVNPRKSYSYTNAAAAVNQPEWVFRVMIGIQYRFGK
jgi:hypothetical protein